MARKSRSFVLRVLLVGASFGSVCAQQIAVSIEWEQLFKLSACSFSSVVQTDDGGYILGGGIYDVADKSHGGDSVLVKVSQSGGIEWQRRFGGTGTDHIQSVVQTRDGGYVFLAASSSPPSEQKQAPHFGMLDAWVVKVDHAGNKEWERSFGGTEDEFVGSIHQAVDEGFILIAGSNSPSSGNKESSLSGGSDGWVIKLDGQGNKQWERSFGGDSTDGFTSVTQTSDGSYVLAGGSHSPSSPNNGSVQFGNGDGWAVKVDPDGKKLWERSFGGAETDRFYSVAATTDGGVVFGGSSGSPPSGNKESRHFGGMDYWIVKVDARGNKQWDRSYGTPVFSERISAVRSTSDGGYALGATGRLVKVDSQGRQQWVKVFGDPRYNEFDVSDLTQTKDGGYVACGSYTSALAGIPASGCVSSSWVIKLEPVPSLSGEAVIWAAEAGMVLESVVDLKDDWEIDDSDVLFLGEASAIPLVYSGQQRYYRLRASGAMSETPLLTFANLLSWPTEANQILEFSSGAEGPWQVFQGEQGSIGETNYGIIPQDMKRHYFRARKNAVPAPAG